MKPIRGIHLIRSARHRIATGEDSSEQLLREPMALVRLREMDSRSAEVPNDGRIGTLEIEFSRFGAWYEIDSCWEGRFMERVQKGAFKSTINRHGLNGVKVFFNHGFDPSVGSKVLGKPEILEERETSPFLQAGLLDTTYNRDLLPGLRAGAYGSSFMFEVVDEKWNYDAEPAEHNPDGLPERTITAVNLFEAGPVTWPANSEATAAVRSGTDWLIELIRERDTDMYEELARCMRAFRAGHGLRRAGEAPAPSSVKPEPEALAVGGKPARHVEGVSAAARKRRLQLIGMARR